MSLADKMKIVTYSKKYKAEVYNLHRTALLKENAFVGSGKWDEDLEDVENIYLKNGTFLLGFINNQLAAMGAFRIISDNTALVKRMRVYPKFQRKGLGQKIYDELEKKAKKMRIKYFVLDTATSLISARNFYRKNGFYETHREKLEIGNREMTLILFKKELIYTDKKKTDADFWRRLVGYSFRNVDPSVDESFMVKEFTNKNPEEFKKLVKKSKK